MWDRLWDFFVETLLALSMPLVCSYHLLTADLFLNVSAQDATGLERAGNTLLIPVQYLLAGQEAIPQEEDDWLFSQRFNYAHSYWPKTISSIAALPVSLVLGSAIKGISYCNEKTRLRHLSMQRARKSRRTRSHRKLYQQLGIPLNDLSQAEIFIPQGYLRRPGEEKKLKTAKEGLAEIAKLFNEADIPWWVDCGTCLGIYRYGGVVPWDFDIDISILLPDFDNARRALNRLDPQKYVVQDWSGRDFPKTYMKVYVRDSNCFIDIDCFSINPKKREVCCIFSLDKTLFFPEWFKIRERRFVAPVAFETLFPLKKGSFDGIEVLLPREPKKYLQRVYGENLSPAKIYNPLTGHYEKDPSHPYWQRAYAH